MRAHIITDGKVSNTIEVESLDFMPGLVDAANGGSIGDLWNGSMFTTPQEVIVVPESVEMAQARLALIDAGLLASVNTALTAMTGIDGEKARAEWEFRPNVRRDSQLVIGIAGSLGLTDQQIDNLFIAASKL